VTVDVETIGPAPLDPRAQQHMVPMRDGVQLATDVYLPDGSGPFPAVLVRLPYDKNGRYCWMPFIASHFIARGYAFLPQDVRGRFRSEGEPVAFVGEVPDGYDTIEWITRQPWSNGEVGMWGDSYYGFTQWAAVASGHTALKAVVPRVTIADIDSWLEGVTPLYGAHYLGEYWTDHATHEWAPDWSHRPLAEVFDPAFEAIGRRSASFDYVLARSRGAARAPLFPDAHPFEVLRIPTLHGVGWFDNITPPHMLDYEELVRNPAAAPFQYLHAGTTDHENYQLEGVPFAESDDHARYDDALEQMLPRYLEPALGFFDAFLMGKGDPASVPRVRWHLGHGGWQESPSWPPPGACELRLYLADPGRAAADAEGGSLVAGHGDPDEATWVHDPGDLVPSTLVDAFSALYEYPDERAVEARPDVLTFTAPPQAEPVTLAGRVVAHLDVRSDGPSLFLHVKLVDVHPDGRAHALLSGQRVVDDPSPGMPVQLYLGHTGYRLLPGHRLRLQVASSDFPLFLPHPGTGESPWDAKETRTNRQTLATGGERPSHLSLTALPPGDR
jgi:predicted acyl esterase